MVQFFKTLSLAPQGIRSKLTVAFALMSLLPMFVFGYLAFYYIFPTVDTFGEIFVIFVITVIIMLLGFWLARNIIYPIAEIAARAKGIAEGRLDEQLEIKQGDEIGELGKSLNYLSLRLKKNMTELNSYGEKIKQINMEINKKVFALSALLQIGNLITTSTNLDEVFNLIVEKLAQLETGGTAFLMLPKKGKNTLMMRAQVNITNERAGSYEVKIGQGLLGAVAKEAQPLIIDAQRKANLLDEASQGALQVENLIALPVISSGKAIGILGMGNNLENLAFSDDEIELIEVFAKQVAIAIENEVLVHKTEELTVQDELTGLYNNSYIRSRLDEEIKRAISYQRPCSFIIFEIGNLTQYRNLLGEVIFEKTLKKIARILKEGTAEIDKAARFSNHQFALLLPEKNRRQALGVMKDLEEKIGEFAASQNSVKPFVSLVISASFSAAPIDGTTATELINKALEGIGKTEKQK